MERALQKRDDAVLCAGRGKLDQLTQTNYLRDAVCIGFILNEAVSILENAGLMGVKIPEVLRSRIDVLRKEEQSK